MKSTFIRQSLPKFRHNGTCLLIINRHFSPEVSKGTISTAVTNKVTSTVKYFDRILGIAEVRHAQSVVTKAEEEFMKSRRNVQESRTNLVQLQGQLRELRSKLDRIPREDERYLQLATEEHRVLIEEKILKTDLETFVALERDDFAALSAAVRNAHEKERSRAERTKYWSIIGSACGAVLGILGSTIINMKRMKQIKITVEENNQAFITRTLEELETIIKSENTVRLKPENSPGNERTTHEVGSGDQLTMTSQENRKILENIYEKVEALSESNSASNKELALLIEQLQLSISKKESSEVKLGPVATASETVSNFEQDLGEFLWSKPGMVLSLSFVTGLSYVVWYTLYR